MYELPHRLGGGGVFSYVILVVMSMEQNLGNQFNCPTCGGPQYSSQGFTPHAHSGSHTLDLDSSDRNEMRQISDASQWHAKGAEIERTRTVDLSNKADLLDHLSSDNGHIIGMPSWRASYLDAGPNREVGKQVPGVRDYRGEDFELTLPELQAMHSHLHRVYGDEEPHVTEGNEHRHL